MRAGLASLARRFPDRLGRVPTRLRRLLLPLWLLLLAVTIVGQSGGLWYGHAYVTRISPAFAALRLDDANAKGEDEGFTIQSVAAAIPGGSRILRIDGQPLAGDATQLEASRLLAGPDGSRVSLDIRTPNGAVRRVQITRDSTRIGKTLRDRRNLTIGFIVTFGLLALTYVGAASLLWRRRPDDSVSVLLSFAFLAIAASGLGPLIFFDEIGAEWILKVLFPAWMLLLMLVLPTFPDGRFVPRWSRWLILLAPAWLAVNLMDVLPDELVYPLLFLLLAVSLSAPFLRYRRTPPGIERQQLKWAALGLGSGVALLTVGLTTAVLLSKGGTPAFELLLGLGSLVFIYVGFLLMPAGVLISLLRYRLNDADAAIGRSTGYAAVTAVVGSVWAMSAYWVQEMLPDVVGQENKGLATAIAALVAVGIFAPVRARLLRWAEARFQRALVRLRDLPVRLAQLQHGDDPREVAEAALEALERGVESSSAAILDADGERLAARGEGGPVALSVPLADSTGPVATLELGPRSDGASYSRDQHAAIATIAPPLASALRCTSRRRRDKAALASALAAIDRRLARIEERSDGGARE